MAIKTASTPHPQTFGFVGDIAVDALVFEFLGVAILALCIIVVAVPLQRRPTRHFSDY
jgi:hypothetical protein